ncbi:MAG TPA: hypothetical protein VHL53_14825 [Acidimicrobiia bacterium]|nr:hypothetical protein [Acidimicrobiia bacterium]
MRRIPDHPETKELRPMIHPRLRHTHRWHRLPAVVLIAAGLGAGAACSGPGSGGANNVASVKAAADKDTSTAGQDAKAKKQVNPEDAALAFAQCMRDHGIDMPDPDTSSGGPGVVTFSASAGAGGGGGAAAADMDKFQTAQKACQDILGAAGPQNITPEQAQEMQDQALAFSKCMRDHGIDMPDPTFDGDGHTTLKLDSGSGIDPSDPKFEAAQQACGSAFGPKGAAGATVAAGGAKGSLPKGAKGMSGGVMVFGGAPAAANGGSR